jgi:hypothetical protein
MSNPFKPSAGLLAKLGSIAQHIDEVSGDDGHAFDWVAIRSLLADREVSAWLDEMHKHALIPVRRTPAQSPAQGGTARD